MIRMAEIPKERMASDAVNNSRICAGKRISVRLEDNPYKTQLKGTTPYFYVRQVLKLKDSIGNFVINSFEF